MKNKILLFGKNGLLGYELNLSFMESNNLASPSHEECDITNAYQVKEIFDKVKPDIVINAAGFTNVDQCEIDPEKANAVNFLGTQNIVNECKKLNCYYLSYSTDYVFDGKKTTPYIENDEPHPINYYGQTKLKAEQLIQNSLENYSILRVSWLYGMHHDNFLKLIIKKGLEAERKGDILSIVNDQTGSPSSVLEITAQTKKIIENRLSGVIHCSSQTTLTRYEMTKMIFDYYKIKTKIEPCLLSERNHQTNRPLYSVLENKILNGKRLNIMKSAESSMIEFLELNRERLLAVE